MSKITFKINEKQHEVDSNGFDPDMSLNEFIRSVADLRGTKAMCHEGGCGVCVVSVRAAMPPTNEIKTFAVNSCLVSVLSCHGWEVTTAEGLGNKLKGYHEIQTRLAKFNGTQCGYCTPGWIMNMHSLYDSKNKKLTMTEIENSFASQICRCTGYRPIADAFKTFATDVSDDLKHKLADLEDLGIKQCGYKCSKICIHKKSLNNTLLGKLEFRKEISEKDSTPGDDDWCVLGKGDDEMIILENDRHTWQKAFKLDDVFKAMGKSDPDYKLIAGNTGQGVYHIKTYPQNLIDISNVAELKGFIIDVNLVLGAGMSLTDMMETFLTLSAANEDFGYLKQFHDHMDLVAHIPVRNIGTIGGNLFLKHINNEFPSDLFLLFETVGAMVTIAEEKNRTTTVGLKEFLKTDFKFKVLVNVMLPPLSHCCSVKTFKIMPRSQNAHAVVNAGFMLKFKTDTTILEKITIVYGNITADFNHATNTEALLVGKDPFTDENLQLALKSLAEEIKPEEAPPEPSAAYRKMLAVTLYYKAILSLCPDDKIDLKYRSGGEAIKRSLSQGTQIFDTDKSVWPLNQPIPKIEALVQCSGETTFANDLPKDSNEVYAAFVTADAKAGSVISGFDTTEAMKLPGVTAFYSAKDIPGPNTFTPTNIPIVTFDEEILCSSEVKFFGQPAGIIVANREITAKKAAELVTVKYSSVIEKKPLLTIDEVLASPAKATRVTNDKTVLPTNTGSDVKCVLHGEFRIEGQYHYTMEPQTCVVKHTEDGLEVYSATQYISLVNVAIAQCIKVPVNSVNVIVRRVGGGYGSKITRASQIACAAGLVAHLQNKTCRFILPLQTNMKSIGKRLPTTSFFEVGVNLEGEIQYLKNQFFQDNGCSSNETVSPITSTHFTNCYDASRWQIEANSVLTDNASNTWCRAPASLEGVAMIEYIMERIAYNTKKDPLQVRLLNMKKENNPIPELIEQLKINANYDPRLAEIKQFNENNRWRKRAMKLIPLTYDLFYFGNYNCIVSVFHTDASVLIQHGGIEMGQGINTKVAQVCAYLLGITVDKISVKPTSPFTSPNTMATGGSIGSELVSYAALKACEILLKRLEPIKNKIGNASWNEIIQNAYMAGVDLQASYMNSPNDGVKPYDIYAVIALEVEVDVLTGNHDVRRVDLLEDTGRSLSPQIDIGQIEGALVMGLGYWTSEKLVYDPDTGKLLTDRTWTYKPPGIKDIPADFRVYFRRNASNEAGVLQSKATGEPASCLAVVLTHALREALAESQHDAGLPEQWVEIKNPCTVENIFQAAGNKLEHYKLKG